jgi:hypothetical protein
MSEIDKEKLPGNARDRQPPEGYGSWLEYAVDTFDSRSNILHTLFEDTSSDLREWIEDTAWAELNGLRMQAGLAPIERCSKRR